MKKLIAQMSLLSACRQLEICGWCPYESEHNLHVMYETCETAKKYGVNGCHDCICKYFNRKAKDCESELC